MTTHKALNQNDLAQNDLAELDASFINLESNVAVPEPESPISIEQVEPLVHADEIEEAINYTDRGVIEEKLRQQNTKTLKTRLLQFVLPAVILPLGIASWVGYSVTTQLIRDDAFALLRQRGLQMNEATDVYFSDAFKTSKLVVSNPSFVDAIKKGNQISASLGLKAKPIANVEKQFAQTKLLEVNAANNNFLKNIANATQMAEAFVTNREGFNVAYSNPTSDFVQSDEAWWQDAIKTGKFIGVTEFDESAKATALPISTVIREPNSGEVLGVFKAALVMKELTDSLEKYIVPAVGDTGIAQLINVESEGILNNITNRGNEVRVDNIVGGETTIEIGKILTSLSKAKFSNRQSAQDAISAALETLQNKFSKQGGRSMEISLEPIGNSNDIFVANYQFQGKAMSQSNVPGTPLISVAAQDISEIDAPGRQLLVNFVFMALLLGAASIVVINLLSNRLSKPITNLADKAQQFADGDMNVRAEVEGTQETQRLAKDFNTMVAQMGVLFGQQKKSVAEQQAAREKLEMEIYQLIDEVGEATDGDLSVRASLSSMEMSTVADLFNAIIDNLAEIATEVKQTTGKVSGSLTTSEAEIRTLAEQAEEETQNTRDVLKSVATMSSSIQDVAENANQAATIATAAYTSVQEGTEAMDRTVNSIQGLRTTVGDTAKKMKRLGESSQKISQVVSLIEEIALKTNLLAINASVEASRAGEQGQGFSVVAEQVGALAEQSAAATKEIAQIVANIQSETHEVSEAMELGTSQVVGTTHLVETTKESLLNSLERSQEINTLMQTISQETGGQVETSLSVTSLMQTLAKQAAERAKSSQSVAESMHSTAQMAQDLEATVAQFKVEEDAPVAVADQ